MLPTPTRGLISGNRSAEVLQHAFQVEGGRLFHLGQRPRAVAFGRRIDDVEVILSIGPPRQDYRWASGEGTGFWRDKPHNEANALFLRAVRSRAVQYVGIV